jgi:hypothetical protein
MRGLRRQRNVVSKGGTLEQKYHGQFTWQRLLILAASSTAVIGWMVWLQINRPPRTATGGKPPVPTPEQWAAYALPVWVTVVVVVGTAALCALLTIRRTRRLPEEEKDWHGPDPHADRKVPVEAWTPSPIMQAAIRRTMSKQAQ